MAFWSSLVTRDPPGSVPVVPATDTHGETTRAGLFVVGDVQGTPLIKLGLNAGHALARYLSSSLEGLSPAPPHRGPVLLGEGPTTGPHPRRPGMGATTSGLALEARSLEALSPAPPKATSECPLHDVVVIGLGPAGLACLVELAARGHTVVGIDAQQPAQTVRDMVPGKHIFAEPAAIPNASSLWLQECTREELLAHWEPLWTALPQNASVRAHARVADVKGAAGDFTVWANPRALNRPKAASITSSGRSAARRRNLGSKGGISGMTH